MSRQSIPVGLASQIYVEPRPSGPRAVYLVEVQNKQEASELSKLFEDFAPAVESFQLSEGKLVSYAVQLHNHDQSLLEEIETFLKKNFEFVILHRSFDAIIYEIVRELSKDSGSELIPVPKCDICGKHDPFPATMVTFLDDDNTSLTTRRYCASCTAESAGSNNKKFLLALLEADRGGFHTFCNAGLIRSRSSKKRVAFKIRWDTQQCAAS